MNSLEFCNQFKDNYNKNFAFAMTLTRNENDAKDLMQETALSVFSNMDKFRPDSNFKAWVSTIIRNNFINNYRKKIRRKKIEAPVEDLICIEDIPLVENEGPINICVAELQLVINQLDELFRIPFLMNYHGYHYQEIAEKLNLPLGTVKSRIFFARKKIKDAIEAITVTENDNVVRFREKFRKVS